MPKVVHPHPGRAMRRSQRRKNKLAQTRKPEYSIPNPYKSPRSQQYLPSDLSKQLAHLDCLSSQSLSNISFSAQENHEELSEIINKMRRAAIKQEQQLKSFIISQVQVDSPMDSVNSQKDSFANQEPADNSIELEQHQRISNSQPLLIDRNIFGQNYQANRMLFHSDHCIDYACMKDDFENFLA